MYETESRKTRTKLNRNLKVPLPQMS